MLIFLWKSYKRKLKKSNIKTITSEKSKERNGRNRQPERVNLSSAEEVEANRVSHVSSSQ
eukprot:gene6682-7199_t